MPSTRSISEDPSESLSPHSPSNTDLPNLLSSNDHSEDEDYDPQNGEGEDVEYFEAVDDVDEDEDEDEDEDDNEDEDTEAEFHGRSSLYCCALALCFFLKKKNNIC
jgi:hypothetical protein